MVVGLNYRTAPMAVRERFWIGENRRYEALVQLSRAEGIEEVIVLSTCNRTEFYLWVKDITLAANSVMRLLGAEYALKLCEWKHFYRLLDEAALLHIFRVVSCLDSMVVGAPHIVPQVKEAWQQAQKVGASGRFLDAVLKKALAVSEHVRSETGIGKVAVSIPSTAVELARQVFGTLANRKILLIGAGEMSELAACALVNQGATSLGIINRTFQYAADMAAKFGGVAIPFEQRWRHMAEADIIISATSSPRTILSHDVAQNMIRDRQLREGKKEDQTLLIVDLAMPRDVDPAVREVKGISLHDLDDLENVSDPSADEREAAAAEADKILQAEARGFRGKLMAERAVAAAGLPTVVLPTIVALRSRLDEICRQELDALRRENGPFSKDQDEILSALMSRMTQRIAGSLARELKELPEKVQQEQMTIALQRLFHLQTAEPALAGGKSA